MSSNTPFALDHGLGKILIIFFVVVGLQIPISYIDALLKERDQSKAAAHREIQRMAGPPQTLFGPVLGIPFKSLPKEGETETVLGYVYLMPEVLDARGTLDVVARRKGIFELPTYYANVTMEGTFSAERLNKTKIAPDSRLVPEEATIFLGLTNAKGLTGPVTLGQSEDMVLDIPANADGSALIGAPLKGFCMAAECTNTFSISAPVMGSEQLSISTSGIKTNISISSPWNDVQFNGSHLPRTRTVNDQGFAASWQVPLVSTALPAAWLGDPSRIFEQLRQQTVGVRLWPANDPHRLVDRSMKYQLLFFVLTFAVFYLFETVRKRLLHPMQYLLVGFSLTMFYLVLLAFAEHVGFSLAYLLASVTVVTMISLYVLSLSGSRAVAAIVGGELSLLYIFLFATLCEERFALLIGTLGLTSALGVTMYLTRNVDWYALRRDRLPSAGTIDG